nr:MAG TPA: hypothetical protein [Caudoviricetes sp.]
MNRNHGNVNFLHKPYYTGLTFIVNIWWRESN